MLAGIACGLVCRGARDTFHQATQTDHVMMPGMIRRWVMFARLMLMLLKIVTLLLEYLVHRVLQL